MERKLLLTIGIIGSIFLLSCTQKKDNEGKESTEVSTAEESIDHGTNVPADSVPEATDIKAGKGTTSSTPATTQGPGEGTSENGLSTDVEETAPKPIAKDSASKSGK